MRDIIQRTGPGIIVLCEIKVGSKKKKNIENYESVSRNCSFGKGGILVTAKYGTYNSFLEVTKSNMMVFSLLRWNMVKDLFELWQCMVHKRQVRGK